MTFVIGVLFFLLIFEQKQQQSMDPMTSMFAWEHIGYVTIAKGTRRKWRVS
jgi:hypothetical protein